MSVLSFVVNSLMSIAFAVLYLCIACVMYCMCDTLKYLRFGSAFQQAMPKKSTLSTKQSRSLEKDGWDPRSMEILGMTDNETINNITRHLGVSRALSGSNDISRASSGSNKDEGKQFLVLHFCSIYSCKRIAKWTNEHQVQDGNTKKNLGGDGADAGLYNFQQSSGIKNPNAVKVEDRPAHNFFLGTSTRKLIGSAPCVYALT